MLFRTVKYYTVVNNFKLLLQATLKDPIFREAMLELFQDVTKYQTNTAICWKNQKAYRQGHMDIIHLQNKECSLTADVLNSYQRRWVN
jgi:hypothetical protein